MQTVKEKLVNENMESMYKLELYRLIGEGYRAMQDGRDLTIGRAKKPADFPKEHSYVADDLLAAVGLRMTVFGNYNIFYYYNEEQETVHIIRILNNKADWINRLKR